MEHHLSLQLTMAREEVTLSMNATLEEKCAAQNALCRVILTLERTKKERLMQQMQGDVESMNAKLEILDSNVIRNFDLYERLMTIGVNLEELAWLNQQDDMQKSETMLASEDVLQRTH